MKRVCLIIILLVCLLIVTSCVNNNKQNHSKVLIALTVSIANFVLFRQDKDTEYSVLKTENDLLDRISKLEKNLEEIKEENDIQNNKIVNL